MAAKAPHDIIAITDDIREAAMASLLIRDLDDQVKQRLRVRAAENGVSMEAEARSILTTAVADPEQISGAEWVRRFRAHFEDIGFADDLADAIPDRNADAAIETSRRLPFVDEPDSYGPPFGVDIRRDVE
ncbi:MAG: hypothetical protein QM598_07915 [Protaetiibacter sp.]